MKQIRLLDVKELYNKLVGEVLDSKKDIAEQKAIFSRIFIALEESAFETQYRELAAVRARFLGRAGK